MGAPVMVELEGETDPLKIAMKELKYDTHLTYCLSVRLLAFVNFHCLMSFQYIVCLSRFNVCLCLLISIF